MTTTINYLLYQAGWFACVLGAAWGSPWTGTAIGAAVTGMHLALARRRRDELMLALWTMVVGLTVDSAQIALGTLRFTSGTFHPSLPPGWLLVVWAQFAMTFHFGLGWLRGGLARSAMFGALSGPVAFALGQRLGVLELHPAWWPSLLTLALFWSVAMPASIGFARQQARRPGMGTYRWPPSSSA